MLDQITGFLGVGNGSTCATGGDGDSVHVRTAGTDNNPCDESTIQQASYDFATYAINAPYLNTDVDNRAYECVPSDKFRESGAGAAGIGGFTWDYDNLSDPGVTVEYGDSVVFGNGSSGKVAAGAFEYYQSSQSGDSLIGQVMFYCHCDPQQTSP